MRLTGGMHDGDYKYTFKTEGTAGEMKPSPDHLPKDAKERKTYPVGTGFLDYFPKAAAEVAHVSFVGNLQHNGPGAPLHWDRTKSTDEADALIRHFLERGKIDSDGVRHSAKMCWRSLALLEKELEAEQERNAKKEIEDEAK